MMRTAARSESARRLSGKQGGVRSCRRAEHSRKEGSAALEQAQPRRPQGSGQQSARPRARPALQRSSGKLRSQEGRLVSAREQRSSATMRGSHLSGACLCVARCRADNIRPRSTEAANAKRQRRASAEKHSTQRCLLQRSSAQLRDVHGSWLEVLAAVRGASAAKERPAKPRSLSAATCL